MRRKNVAIEWIDYKKAYDIIPQTWIMECLKMSMISNRVVNFITKPMKNKKVKLTAGRESLAEVKIKRGVFSLSPLLFVIETMSLDHISRKCKGSQKFTKSQ